MLLKNIIIVISEIAIKRKMTKRINIDIVEKGLDLMDSFSLLNNLTS